ncbi:hypothetical protein CCM_06317 [Cordyceps militaris CM01]|uniref:Glycosyltransferase 2-like domain-containing protein n=1 Tax=Cordyceps militaris (strain CM01) TaxID=983644 RepID=G3JK26_CORMM|nr:uncharacterized protein CCM_06317 [Cordyceps militaris CM01]EGX92156.1 hypothetical protein CCM_06317 [Cordyceps militaris CM01]
MTPCTPKLHPSSHDVPPLVAHQPFPSEPTRSLIPTNIASIMAIKTECYFEFLLPPEKAFVCHGYGRRLTHKEERCVLKPKRLRLARFHSLPRMGRSSTAFPASSYLSLEDQTTCTSPSPFNSAKCIGSLVMSLVSAVPGVGVLSRAFSPLQTSDQRRQWMRSESILQTTAAVMAIFAWFSRRVGGLSLIALLTLTYWVLSHEYNAARRLVKPDSTDKTPPSRFSYGAGVWSYVFAYYSLLIHFLVFIAPIRACMAVWDITASLRKDARLHAIRDYKTHRPRRDSQASISSSETLTTERLSISASSVDPMSDIELSSMSESEEPTADSVIHAIIIPNYKEEIDTLRESLEVLACHPHAAMTYDASPLQIYLGMEQREVKGESKALELIQEFGRKFRRMDYTTHPGDIPGEAAGKGSNMAWAAKKLSEKYSTKTRNNVVITSMDADSHLASKYFAQVTNMHLSNPDTALNTLYAAPIIFDRNAHNVPALVRTADVLWCAAGMSGLYNGSVLSPPTSVYSVPLALVDRVGGWDTDAEAIGEDLHMFVKCFFATNGNLTCRTIMSPVSQSNITSGSGAGIRGAARDIGARYSQALRDDADFYVPENQANGGDAEVAAENGIFSDVVQETIQAPDWERIFYMYHRLFEAHFLPVHMAVLVIASAIWAWITEGNGDPNGLSWTFTISAILRTVGFMAIGAYLFLYESYHRLAVQARERDMRHAGLDSGMSFSHRSFKKNILDYTLIPLVAPLYGTVPAMQAAVAQLWTVNLVYQVSKKESRQKVEKPSVADMA